MPSIDYGTGEVETSLRLWQDERGNWVEGKRAYFPHDPSLDVKLGRIGAPGDDLAGVGCWVEFSVPRRAEGDNFHAVDLWGTQQALVGVERQLDQIGIKADLNKAIPVRTDIKRTVEVEESWKCYSGLFNLLEMKRMKSVEFEEGWRAGNTQQQLTAYDKVAESLFKLNRAARRARKKPGALDIKGNWINFEKRLVVGRKVEAVLGARSVEELLAGYDRVGEAYRETWRKYVFGRTVDEVEAQSQRNLEAEMVRFKEARGRNWLQHYLKAAGMISLTDVHRVEVVIAALAAVEQVETDNDKRKLRRYANELREAHLDAQLLREARPSKRTLGQLYRELQEKVLAIN